MERTKVYVCPAFNAFYYSFYVQGVLEAFRNAAVRFSSHPFPPFASNKLAFIVKQDGSEKRVLIDAADRPDLDGEALEWSGVYGKVNRLSSVVPAGSSSRVLPIGPGFACRVWDPMTSWVRAVAYYQRARGGIESVREHFANWRRQYKYALLEKAFEPRRSRDRFVFSSNTLWKDDFETNRHRAVFFEACRSLPGIEFEGGFTPRKRGDVPGFEQYMLPKRYQVQEYVEKTKQSAVVFNTPAVFECHGWKLGEYLALGKAIISTLPKRELPAPLVHGKHIHFVDGSFDAMSAAIRQLVEDREYRARLEAGARAYYLEHLRPRRVVERLIGETRA